MISEIELYQHLDNYAPTWREAWEEAKTSIKNQQAAGTVSPESEQCLVKLQKIIINCFGAHEFLLEDGSPDIIEMARSSGRHEDKADMANPGGNESLPCDASKADRSRAIGQVLASFFGAKSFNQRLASDPANESILELPGGGVVLQEMVGEGINGHTQVRSLVAYTNGDIVKMQVAPGHGKQIVNSKSPGDTYSIASTGIVHAEIVAKPFRDKPKISNIAGQQKVELEQVENDAILKYSPSISNPVALLYMQELFQHLKKEYGIELDLESIYAEATESGKDDVINVVQGRAIPEGNHKGRSPSTISPEFLAKNKDTLQIINGLQVITPEIKSAAFITNMNQVVLADNCDQAESKYNAISDKSAIKAIIVQNREQAMSHASGFFLGQGLVVMQVKDTSNVEKLLRENSKLPLIADPQRRQIYQLPPEYANATEEQLFQQGGLVKGIYGSSESNYITALKYDFSGLGDVKIVPLARDSMLDINVGQIILEALTGNKESFEKPLSIAATAFEYRKADDISTSNDKALILRDHLSKLTTLQIGQENSECRQALGYTLRAILKNHEEKLINPDLGKQAMIIGSELHLLLNKIEALPANLEERQKNKIYIEYFDVLKKFEGLIIGEGDSLAKSLKANKYRKIAEELSPGISEQAKEYLIENLRLGDYLSNQDPKTKETTEKWNKFCASICTSPNISMAKMLSAFTTKLVSYNVHNQWLNTIFIAGNDPQDPQKTLANFIKDFNKIDLTKIQHAVKAIDSLDKQISQWAEPKNWEELYPNLQKNLEEISKDLKWNPQATKLEQILSLQQAHKSLNIIDKNIKSLGNPNLYPENLKDQQGNNLQAVRFKEMLIPFSNFVSIWIENADFKGSAGIKAKERLIDNQLFMQEKDSSTLTKDELLPSAGFAVNRATIDILGGRPQPKTLADFHTLEHQQGEVAFNRLYKAIGINDIIISQCPPLVQSLSDKFDKELIGKGDKKIYPSTTVELKNGTSIINKNLPLNTHAATAKIKYTPKTDVTSVKFDIFGDNDYNRWKHVVLDSYLDLMDDRCSFITLPYFDPKKETVDFEVQVDSEEQAKAVIQAINKSFATSFNCGKNDYILNLLKSRLERLEKLSIEKPELVPELDKLYFLPKVPIIYSEFKDLQKIKPAEASFILNNYLNIITSHKTDDLIPFQELRVIYDKDEKEGEFIAKNSAKIYNLQKQGFIATVEEFRDLYKKKPEKVDFLLSLELSTISVMLPGINFTPQRLIAIYDIKKEKAELLVKYIVEIGQLNRLNILPFHKLMAIYDHDEAQGEWIAKTGQQIHDLGQKYGFITTVQEVRDLSTKDPEKAELILKFDTFIMGLPEFGLTPQKLMAIYDIDKEQAELLVKNSIGIYSLTKKSGVTIQEFIEEYDPHLVKFIMSNCVVIQDICASGELTLQDFLKSNVEQIQKLLNAEITPENFKKSLIKPATQQNEDKLLGIKKQDHEVVSGLFDAAVISNKNSELNNILITPTINIDVDLPALYKAIQQGDVEGADLLFKQLVDKGISLADPSLNKIIEGKTCTLLDIVLESPQDTTKMTETLLSYPTGRSLLTKQDLNGFTPLENVRRRGNIALVAVLEDAYIEIVKEQLVKYFQEQLEDKKTLTSTDTKAMRNKVEEILSPLFLNANKKDIIQIAGPMVRKGVEIAGRKLDWQQKLRRIIDIINMYLPTAYSPPQAHKIKNILKDKAVIASLRTLKNHQFKVDPKKISTTTVPSKQSIKFGNNKEL